MYAIAFDLDTDSAERLCGPAWRTCHAKIAAVFAEFGFSRVQGSVYFGGDMVNAVTCVVAVIDLTNTFPWFAKSVRDIRMLRIEEQNDLAPAIQQALAMQSNSKSDNSPKRD